jgi:hypothetical protein
MYGCAAKLIERCLHAVDDGAILDVVARAVDVDRRGKREWPRAFELHKGLRAGTSTED